MKKRLAWGKPLGEALAQQPIDSGKVWTWLPTSKMGAALNFEEEPEWMSQDEYLPLFDAYAGRWANGQPTDHLMIEDRNTRAGDPVFQWPDTSDQWMTAGESVYWYSPVRSSSFQTISKQGWMFFSLYVLTTIPPEIALVPRGKLEINELETLAASVEHLAIPAYDFASWVFWSRI